MPARALQSRISHSYAHEYQDICNLRSVRALSTGWLADSGDTYLCTVSSRGFAIGEKKKNRAHSNSAQATYAQHAQQSASKGNIFNSRE